MAGLARRPGLHAFAVLGGFLHVVGIPVVLIAASPSSTVRMAGVVWYLAGFWFWGWLWSISD